LELKEAHKEKRVRPSGEVAKAMKTQTLDPFHEKIYQSKKGQAMGTPSGGLL
jgi:hypothetical protein